MKRIPVITMIALLITVVSCGKRAPEISHSIPDDAFMVTSFHPGMLHEKGQIATFNNITSKIDNDILKGLIEDPVKSGIDIGEYAYVFAYFENDSPVIGVTAVLSDEESFIAMVNELLQGSGEEVVAIEGFSLLAPDNGEAAMVWNEQQVVFLTAPDQVKSSDEWELTLVALFDLAREEAVTSVVDFIDFRGNMKDINIWFTGDELKRLLDLANTSGEIDIQFPIELYNNYAHAYMEFEDGAMYVHSENHLSDDVAKAAGAFMVAKDNLNEKLLDLAPGNDLLMAMAFSLELEKAVDMMKNFSPPELDTVGSRVEDVTGIPGNELLEALSGDFVIAINGASEGSALPIEIMIGIGLDDESIQEKLMDKTSKWAEVEEDGDFFMINANGMELYSGIVDGILVITNAKGYKEAVSGSGLEKTLRDSKFEEFAGGSLGMYLNMDVSTYPAAIQAMITQGGAPDALELVTGSLTYLGMEASGMEGDMTLKTSKEDENSLYTLLKLMEEAGKKME